MRLVWKQLKVNEPCAGSGMFALPGPHNCNRPPSKWGKMRILHRGLIAARYPLSSIFLSLILPNLVLAGPDAERIPVPQVHEEMWAIPSSPVPMLAYFIRPIGGGPFPLVVMNHGVLLDATGRSYFPMIEFRGAA